MRIEILPLAALLALGCAHKPAPAPVVHIPDLDYYVPGDERVPVRTAADVVGRYRSVLNNEVLTIYVDSGELMMRSNHDNEPRRMAIGSDGGLGINASLRARPGPPPRPDDVAHRLVLSLGRLLARARAKLKPPPT